MKIKQKVLNIVNSNDYIPLTFDELSSRLNIEKKDKKIFHKIINELQKDKKILLDKNSNIIPITEQKAYPGTIQGSGSDFCYFIPDDENVDDIFIAKKDLNGAIHKDKVLVTITVEKKPNRSPEGKVLQILSRETKKLVGTFDEAKGYGFVILDDKKYGFDVFVQSGNKNGAKNNDKVVVKLIKTPSKKHKNPEGVIVEVLGGKDDPGIDIYSIAKTFKLPYEFPKKVKLQAKEIEQHVDESEKKSRMDFRDLFTVTIDGSDAKDFDDAISITKKEENFVLYVHIADVSHYVKKNTALDKEAFRRGTSVYMLDRVIPMLPVELSNGICSLNPNEDRLCLTVKMEISPTGKTLDYKFYESVINSDYRLVYKNVSDFLEDIDNPYEDKKLTDNLLLMKELYEILSARRKKRGSIDFDFPETKIILDENSKVIDVTKDERRIGNKLIEEFMLITNETVASHFGYLDRPFLYRVHEEPDEEKVNTFKRILSNFGYHLKGKNLYSKDYQRILNELDGKPEKPLLASLLLRSMQKAEYSENPSIHFGLASIFYTHFTSPIRRYPDLFIHRIVKNFINHKPDTNNEKEFMKYIKDIAKQCSSTERRAEEAEREAIDMKSAEYMQQHIDEEFEGIISSLTKFGIFVQLDNTIEGLVQFQSMIDDYYVFDEKNYTVYGERTKKSYHIGQKVRVKVINSDKDKRQIDFEFVN